MFEVLLEIDVNNLTPQKMNTILVKYEAHADYDLIFSYLQAVRQTQVAKLDDPKSVDKKAIDLIAQEIRGLLASVEDPALSELRKAFTTDSNRITATAFRCATAAIAAVFEIKNETKRRLALPYLNKILTALGAAFKAFSCVTDFHGRLTCINNALNKWENDLTEKTAQTVASITAEKNEIEEELKRVKEESASASGRTIMSTRIQQGKPPRNNIHDAHTMRLFWRESKVHVFELLLIEYQTQIQIEQRARLLQNGGGTHRTFTVGQSKSALLLNEIKDLCAERKNVQEVILSIQRCTWYKNSDIENRFNTANQAGLLSDLTKEDPVPGLEIPADKQQDTKYIKSMHKKLSRIANMWGNEENTSLLPYDKKSANDFAEHVTALEKQFSSLTEGSAHVNKHKIKQ